MENNTKRIHFIKYTCYAILFLLLFILQTTPAFLRLFGQKPQLLLPAAVCVAMYEGEFVGGLFGAWAGILCDMAANTSFGFYSVQLLVICVGIGLAVIYYMKSNQLGALLLCAGTLGYFAAAEYLLYFAMWGYEGNALLLITTYFPRVVYSLLFAPIFYWAFGRANQFFADRIHT